MRTRTGQAPRTGFTLVELLVVITIIAVLAALGTGAYQKVRVAGKRTATVSEINNMNVAIGKFKHDFGFNPPQYMRFPVTTPPNAAPNAAEKDAGYAILQSMFRAYGSGLGASATLPLIPFGAATDMRGSTISASQCLVFFLGGPQLQGFDSTGPYTPAGTSKKGPYMEFSDINRISAANEYLDTWGTPYAFFSSGRSNGYDITASQTIGGVLMRPFWDKTKKWVNAGGVQIISAGPNQVHGGGSGYVIASGTIVPWAPEEGPPMYAPNYGPGDPGEDDIGNFNGGLQLGSSSK